VDAFIGRGVHASIHLCDNFRGVLEVAEVSGLVIGVISECVTQEEIIGNTYRTGMDITCWRSRILKYAHRSRRLEDL
jgi:hypothetical protein